jgi:formate hydrogenlyase subunit 6/NADH:ubiquinone oxidoreductase subunit I
MKWPKLRELWEAIKAVISGPYTSSFPKEPFHPHPNFRGQYKFNQQKCVGCLACEEVCPVNAIAHEDRLAKGTSVRTMIHYSDTCIFCGQCEAACISDHEGIKTSPDWELSFFDRKRDSFETIQKELQLCEMCGSAIACKDHLNWIAEKLGELTYSSPTLYQSRLQSLNVIDPNLQAVAKDLGRSDRVKILCAPCRRETTLTTK